MPGAGFAHAAGPPEGFSGDLFIDSKGCVLERIGRRWQERLLRDGERDCGYPPTPLGRDQGRRPAGIDLPLAEGLPLPEAKLLAIMADGLTEGDLKSPDTAPADMDDRPSLDGDMAAPTAEGGKGHPVLQELAAALGADAAQARVIVAGGQPNARLCALLGADRAGGISATGADPSRGFCPDLGPDVLGAALRPARLPPAQPQQLVLAESGNGAAVPAAVAAKPVPGKAGGADAQDSADGAGMATSRTALLPEGGDKPSSSEAMSDKGKGGAQRPAERDGQLAAQAPGMGAADTPRPATGRDRGVTARAPAAPRGNTGQGIAAPAEDMAMIPAGARYLQIGDPVSPDAAAEQFRRLAALGLPVARGRAGDQAETVLVMAGPFPSREGISRALDQLRRAGFRNIVPR